MTNEQPPDSDDFEQDQQPRTLLDRIGDYGLALAEGTLRGQDVSPGEEAHGQSGWITRRYRLSEAPGQGVSLTVRAFDRAAKDISVRFEWLHTDTRPPVTLPIPIAYPFWNDAGSTARPEAVIFQNSTIERHEDPNWLTPGRINEGYIPLRVPGWYARISPLHSEVFANNPRQTERGRAERRQQVETAIARYALHAPLDTLPHYATADEAINAIRNIAASKAAERVVDILRLLASQYHIMSVDEWLSGAADGQAPPA